MATYGLTLNGFVPKTFEVIRDEINTAVRAAYGDSVDVSDGSVLGQFIAIIAERYSLLWELGEAINSATDPDKATGAKLHAIGALTGVVVKAAASSTVTATLTGTPTTVVGVGSVASVADTAAQFKTTAAATIVASTAWAGTTAYVIGDIVTNGSRIYRCSLAGTSAGSGGPVGTTYASVGETDGTAEWDYMGDGTGHVDVAMESSDTGAVIALSRTLTDIVTPVSGWSNVVNTLDATLGRDIESDEDFRVRREDELDATGSSTHDALRANLLKVTGVTSVTIFSNRTELTDGDGVPPHAVEALVETTGTDQSIFDALLANVADGIQTHGTTVGTAEDSQGTSHTMKFTKPTVIDIYADITLDYDAKLYPSNGDDLVKTAVSLVASETGLDVTASRLKAAIMAGPNAVAGVLDVSVANIGTAPAPGTETTIAIALRELADYDTSRVTVTSSAATP